MAKSTDMNLLELISSKEDQFIIPIYQRSYTWQEEDVEKLVDDLIEFAKENIQNTETKYFVGNVVLKEVPKKDLSESLTQHIVVDGQQRITTTLLILITLFKIDPLGFKDIENIIKLREKGEEKLKIDRLYDGNSIKNILENRPTFEDKITNIYKNYLFLKNKFKSENISREIYNALKKSLVIRIKLDTNENQNKVFETINSSGKRLEEHDLIKNHIFYNSTNWNHEDEIKIIREYEKSIKLIDEKYLNDFYRHFSVIYNNDKSLPSKSKPRNI